MKAIDAGMPRTTKVMGQRSKVQSVKDLKVDITHLATTDVHEEWVHEEQQDVLGTCDRDMLIIQLETETGHDRFRETFVHEHLHAMISKAGLHNDLLTEGREEGVVARLSPILLQFLRDNPNAIEFLTDRRQGGAGSAGAWR